MEADHPHQGLPSDIIFCHILPRLPPAFLVRCCRFVCKSWFSIIRDPAFVTAYNSNKRTKNLLFQWKGYFFSSQIDQKGNPRPVAHLSYIPRYSRLSFAQSINGLVCGSIESEHVVFNLSTGESIRLPLGRTNSDATSHHFGFCPSTNEYKVLQIGCGGDNFMMKIFTLGYDSWRTLDVDYLELPFDPQHLPKFQFKKGVCIRGAIHLMLKEEDVIVVFDVGDETFGVIPLPQNFDARADEVYHDHQDHQRNNYFTTCDVLEVEGCLGVYGQQSLGHKRIELWILKDYKNHMWVKQTINIMWKDTVFFGHAWNVKPLCTIHTSDLALGLQLVPYEEGAYGGGPPRLHLYNMKSRDYGIHDFIFPKTISTKHKRAYRLRDLTKIKLLGGYGDGIVPLQ